MVRMTRIIRIIRTTPMCPWPHLMTASGMEQEKPRPYQAELGVLGSPMGLWCMALVASSLFCS